jgi:hypothetical protein
MVGYSPHQELVEFGDLMVRRHSTRNGEIAFLRAKSARKILISLFVLNHPEPGFELGMGVELKPRKGKNL